MAAASAAVTPHGLAIRTDGALARPVGAAGILTVLSILVAGPLSGRPDAFAADAAKQYQDYLAGHLSSVAAFFVLSAISFVPTVVFLGGLGALLLRPLQWSVLGGITLCAVAMFGAGAIASDAFNYGPELAVRNLSATHIDANTVLLLQGAWEVCLIEAMLAFSTAMAAVCTAALVTGALPRWLAVYGIVAAADSLVMPFFAGAFPVFIASNVSRFGWIIAVSLLLLLRPERVTVDREE